MSILYGAFVLGVLAVAPQQETLRWSVDLGKHCAVHVGGRRGTEVPGRAETMAFEAVGIGDFHREQSRVTFGPHPGLGVTSRDSFTIECEVRTTNGRFATILMCREGGKVHYSLIVGRETGRVALELWSWSRERAMSRYRLDDGEWHRLQAAYDGKSRKMALLVDGRLDAVVPVTQGFDGSKAPGLRLGDNLDPNVKQPFVGQLRNLKMTAGVPERLRAHFTLVRETTLFEGSHGRDSLRAWLGDLRRPQKPEADSAAEWRRRAGRIRARVQDALGLWPPPYSGKRLQGRRSPLMGDEAAAATDFGSFRPSLDLALERGGRLVRDGYTLERVYWQTFRGYWASGWLYEPEGVEGRLPAVLCPHGHWRDGARHPTVQARCITLAKLGYVVLAVDSIHLYEDRVGLTPVSVMTWNNLRGLELLRSRPNVDPERIGVTGASGGGQQTYYLTALDADLAAAAPAVMACHFSEILLADNVHCACNFVAHVVQAADVPQMSAAFAPRPQLFLSVTGDWTKRFPTQGYPPIRAVYEQLGAGGHVSSQQWEQGHDYNRPMRNAMYAFFERWLKGVAKPSLVIEQEDPAPETSETLRALDRGDVSHETKAITREFWTRLAADPPTEDTFDREAARRRLADLFLRDEWRPEAGQGARRLRPWRWRGKEHEAWAIRIDPRIELPALLLRAEKSTRGVAIVTGPHGKAGLLEGRRGWIDGLLAEGQSVLLVDLRYTGELDQEARWRDVYGRIFGRDEGILQVRDLRRVLDALGEVPGLAGVPRLLVGFGETGAAVVFTAALDKRVARVLAPELGYTYRSFARRPWVSRILLHGDLPAAMAVATERSVAAGAVGNLSAYAVAVAAGARLGTAPLSAGEVRVLLR